MEGFALLFKVLWAPGEAMFRAVKNNKTVLAPILLLTIAGIALAVVVFSHINMGDVAMRALERSGRAQQMTPEVKERVMAQANGPIPRVMSMVFATIGPTLTIFLVTLIYFGVFSIVGREAKFPAFFAVTAFAFVPLIVRDIAAALSVLVVPSTSLEVDEIGSISPSIFVDRGTMSRPLFTFINQIDVISIWILLLLVIGYGFVVRKGTSATARTASVFAVWLFWVGLRMVLSSIFPT